MTAKEKINEAINILMKTANTLDHSTSAEVKGQIFAALEEIEKLA